MTLLWVWMFHSIFGIIVKVKQVSTKDRLERKKYLGVCRWQSEMTARMISRFPKSAIRYMENERPNMKECTSNSSENPRNCVFPELSSAMWW